MINTGSFNNLVSGYNSCCEYISGAIHEGFKEGEIFSCVCFCSKLYMVANFYPNRWILMVSLSGMPVVPFRMGEDNGNRGVHTNYAVSGHCDFSQKEVSEFGNFGMQVIQLLRNKRNLDLFNYQIDYWKQNY